MSITQQLMAAAFRAVRWHEHSQEVSRRNAMTASTALTQRRIEWLEVEEFLAGHLRERADRQEVGHHAG
jgi:hypothetical protein